MNFEHIIVINDGSHPALTRSQLWRGLVKRAEQPALFMPHLDQCILTQSNTQGVKRECHYGKLHIHDIVTYTEPLQVLYHVPEQGEVASSDLSMVIEEPQLDAFFVRFVYTDNRSDDVSEEEKMVNNFRCSAYEAADNDTIRVIRELAAEGQLGE